MSKNRQNFRARYAEEVERLRAQSQELDSLMKNSREELEQLRTEFLDIQAFKEPAEYWRRKRTRHWIATGSTTLVTLLVGGGGLRWLLAESSIAQGRLEALQAASVWVVVAAMFHTFVIATLLFWLLRVLVRFTLSNMHLATDAAERVELVNTYLSLKVGEQDPEGPGGLLVLSQLFRQAQTGIVRDDAAPRGVPWAHLDELTKD